MQPCQTYGHGQPTPLQGARLLSCLRPPDTAAAEGAQHTPPRQCCLPMLLQQHSVGALSGLRMVHSKCSGSNRQEPPRQRELRTPGALTHALTLSLHVSTQPSSFACREATQVASRDTPGKKRGPLAGCTPTALPGSKTGSSLGGCCVEISAAGKP